MEVFRKGALRMAVLVVAMLAAVGAWEISKGAVLKAQGASYQGGQPGVIPPDALFDHFVCYKIKRRDGDPRFRAVVEIKNQFEYSIVKVKDKPRLLCVPTAKELISLEPRDHHDRHDGDHDDDYEND